jgi:hypothetical protein
VQQFGGGRGLPSANAGFNFITTIDVLEHIEDLLGAMRESRRAAGPRARGRRVGVPIL